MRATVSHFEIPARDPERAAVFYRRVFGWAIEARAWGEEPYFSVRTEGPDSPPPSAVHGAIQGGIAPASKLGAEQPLLVVHVSGMALGELLRRIEAAGGTAVQEPERIGTEGAFARFRDPEGNLLGLWSQAPLVGLDA